MKHSASYAREFKITEMERHKLTKPETCPYYLENRCFAIATPPKLPDRALLCTISDHKYCPYFYGEPKMSVKIDKGSILLVTEGDMVLKITANSLGDGIKRIVSFFKDMKKTMRADVWEEYNALAGKIEELLEKHKIDLEAL